MRGLRRTDFEPPKAKQKRYAGFITVPNLRKLQNRGHLTVAAVSSAIKLCSRVPLVDVDQLAFGGKELVELWLSGPFQAVRNCEAIHPARR